MYGVYATAWQVAQYIDTYDEPSYVVEDDRFLRFTVQMSRKFDTLCKRHFVPFRETHRYDHPSDALAQSLRSGGFEVFPNELLLDKDLLSLISLTSGNGNVTITSSSWLLKNGYSYNYTPYDRIELKVNAAITTFTYSGTPQQSNTVVGLWGYHEQYSDAWQLLDTVQDGSGISAAATSFTATDADAFDELGLKPRFQAQQLLRFGSSDSGEFAYVKSVNYSANTVTIVRGVNGTTAASQSNGTEIYVYRPPADIEHAALILATHAYRRKDSVGADSDQPFAASGVLALPPRMPAEVVDILKAYKRPLRNFR